MTVIVNRFYCEIQGMEMIAARGSSLQGREVERVNILRPLLSEQPSGTDLRHDAWTEHQTCRKRACFGADTLFRPRFFACFPRENGHPVLALSAESQEFI